MPRLRTIADIAREQVRILRAAGRVGSSPADRLFNTVVALLWPRLATAYRETFGTYPDVARPRTLSDKVQHRKLFDRDPRIVTFCDKLATREYARRLLPDLELPDLLWSGPDPAAMPLAELQPPFVVKPNNRSNRIIFVRRPEDLDQAAIVARCHEWLGERRHGRALGEWGYGRVPGRIMVERYLDESTLDDVPSDYKMFVFDGRTQVIYHSAGRGSGTRLRGWYTPEWERLSWHKKTPTETIPLAGTAPRPPDLERMVSIADRLGAGIGFLRVDLYNLRGRIVLGELTAYPYSGIVLIYEAEDPLSGRGRDIDERLGALWPVPEIPLGTRVARAMTGW